jgi:hypothetical protein
MASLTRREFLGASGAAAGVVAALGTGLGGCASGTRRSGQRVVVIGGGWGGATAAKCLRHYGPGLDVVLLEPSREFVSCPFKEDRRNPGDPGLAALKALMKTIPDAAFGDLAAYYSSLR